MVNTTVLGEKSKIYRGGSPRPIQEYLTDSFDGVNWIKIGDVSKDDKYIRKTEEKIIREGVANSREVFPGDLILSNSMSFGRPYILDIYGCIHDGWLVIQDYKDTYDPIYLYYALGSDVTYSQYVAMAAGSSVQNLNKDKVSKVLIYTPEIDEQKRIAEALSDIDELIVALEKQVKKKRFVKEGTIQKLLTGEIRLPGYNSPWVNTSINDVFELPTETVETESFDNRLYVGTDNMIPNYGGVRDNALQLSYFRVRKYKTGDILMSNIRPYLKKVWFATNDGGCSNDVIVFRSRQPQKYYPRFLNMIIAREKFANYVMENAVGTKMPRGDKGAIKKFEFMIPTDYEEQKEITTVIDTMELEINALEKKLKKYQNIKTGMMQELLSGRKKIM